MSLWSSLLDSAAPGLLAYIGPGGGLALVGSLVGLALAVLTAFSMIALWPVRALLRTVRSGPTSQNPCASAAKCNEPVATATPADRDAS